MQNPEKQTYSRRRIAAFIATTVLICWLGFELIAFASWSILHRQWFSYENFSQLRERIIEAARVDHDETAEDPLKEAKLDEMAVFRGFLEDGAMLEVIHPYMGFVWNPYNPGLREFGMDEFGVFSTGALLAKRSPETLRVLLTGGSVALQVTRAGLEPLAQTLQADPRYGGKMVEFFCVTLGGFKQPQQLMALAWLLSLGAEFDLVINLDGFNEVALHATENALRDTFYAYPRGWALRFEETRDVRLERLVGRTLVLEEDRSRLAQRFKGSLWRWSVVGNILWSARDGVLAQRLAQVQEAIQAYQPPEINYELAGPQVELAEGEVYPRLARLWAQSSLQMDSLCEANGIAYFHFLQPNQYAPGSDKPMSATERAVAWDEDHFYRPGVITGYPLLREQGEWLRKQGVAFTDLTGMFDQIERPIYSDACCHLTLEGIVLLAQAMGERILAGQAPAQPEE